MLIESLPLARHWTGFSLTYIAKRLRVRLADMRILGFSITTVLIFCSYALRADDIKWICQVSQIKTVSECKGLGTEMLRVCGSLEEATCKKSSSDRFSSSSTWECAFLGSSCAPYGKHCIDAYGLNASPDIYFKGIRKQIKDEERSLEDLQEQLKALQQFIKEKKSVSIPKLKKKLSYEGKIQAPTVCVPDNKSKKSSTRLDTDESGVSE